MDGNSKANGGYTMTKETPAHLCITPRTLSNNTYRGGVSSGQSAAPDTQTAAQNAETHVRAAVVTNPLSQPPQPPKRGSKCTAPSAPLPAGNTPSQPLEPSHIMHVGTSSAHPPPSVPTAWYPQGYPIPTTYPSGMGFNVLHQDLIFDMDLLVRAFVTLSASLFAHCHLRLLSFALLSSITTALTSRGLALFRYICGALSIVAPLTTASSLGLYLTSIVGIFATNGPRHSQPSGHIPSHSSTPEGHSASTSPASSPLLDTQGSFDLYLTSIVVPSPPITYPSPLGLYSTSVIIPSPPITHGQVMSRRGLSGDHLVFYFQRRPTASAHHPLHPQPSLSRPKSTHGQFAVSTPRTSLRKPRSSPPVSTKSIPSAELRASHNAAAAHSTEALRLQSALDAQMTAQAHLSQHDAEEASWSMLRGELTRRRVRLPARAPRSDVNELQSNEWTREFDSSCASRDEYSRLRVLVPASMHEYKFAFF
ncbi:hypothetical protein EDB89DRAFT_2080519 [Lactarius sanguifluus]|nr:hypothetical protein EDB89DRAFT_2080519 [Lactarius sanguifluus]